MTTATIPQVGETAPDFRLKGPEGAFVTLSEYRDQRPVLLVFFPLAFSPTCAHQLPTIEALMPRLRERGIEVLGISVDSHWANAAFARSLGLSFPLLSDFRREACAAWGMLFGDAGIANRALFLVGRDGRVTWRDVAANPGELPSNDALLAAVAALP